MNKRTLWLVGVALLLGAAYLRFFIDWNKGREIHIIWDKSRPMARRANDNPVIVFHLVDEHRVDKPYPLTSIKVVETDDALTNEYPHALWYLIATNTPVPTDTFRYGGRVKGMKPEIASALPEPLDPDTSYTLLVEAGKNLKGKCTFQLQ